MKKIFITILTVLTAMLSLSAQTITIRGTVTAAEDGLAIPGVAIMDKASGNGVVTDLDGKYEITVPKDAVLTFSSLGYKDFTSKVPASGVLDVVLESDALMLEEVVAIGYGMVKKKDLTGALTTINGDAILQRKSNTIGTALQGAMPGVTVTRTHSAPGSEPTITVRGITSITGDAQEPYVLIDGVPGKISDVNPNDVENITVLKDAASASIYGSQAAAGVVLITTKRGTGEKGVNITYNYTLGFDTPTAMPQYLNAVEYMEYTNELRYNDLPASGWYQSYNKDIIENYARLHAENPDIYPDENWTDIVLKPYAVRHSHALSLKNSTDKRSTSLNIGYDTQDGLFKGNLKWDRYTVRLNNDFQVKKWLKASADMSLRMVNKLNPVSSPSAKMKFMSPLSKAVFSNGKYAPGTNAVNPYAALMSGGETHQDDYVVTGKFALDIKPFKGMTVTALFSPKFVYSKEHSFTRQTCYWFYGDDSAVTTNYISGHQKTSLEESRSDYLEHTTQVYANYNETFGDKHNVGAMVGYENYHYAWEKIRAKNNSYSHSLIENLSAGNTDDLEVAGATRELARRSYFGRVMYNYDSRYYLQGNIRHDGSSRFAPEHRWGTFLSASAGWVFTNESFMKTPAVTSWLDHGKLRLSYGELGNERIGSYYPYQVSLDASHQVAYQGDEVVGVTGFEQKDAVVSDLTWESTSTVDVGLDLSMLGHRLSVTADWYYKKTKDMLLTVPIAPIIGLTDPYDNIGDMYTKGWEFSLGWRDAIGDFTYSVNFNLSDDTSIVGYIGNKEIISGGKIVKEGVEYKSYYGFHALGIFQSKEEIQESPLYKASTEVGDMKYANIKDADPTNPIINASDDRLVLGSSLPHMNYGGNIYMAWKGFDFSMAFQGVGKRNSYMTDEMVATGGSQNTNIAKFVTYNRWSYKNTAAQNLNAKYPRYSWSSNDNNFAISDWWIFNGAYMRIKDISLGYTIPSKVLKNTFINTVRVSATLSDFFTFSHYPVGWDPEVGMTSYPVTKAALFSINIAF